MAAVVAEQQADRDGAGPADSALRSGSKEASNKKMPSSSPGDDRGLGALALASSVPRRSETLFTRMRRNADRHGIARVKPPSFRGYTVTVSVWWCAICGPLPVTEPATAPGAVGEVHINISIFEYSNIAEL